MVKARIRQAEQLVTEIKRLRSGEFGQKAKSAAIVVVGDYNSLALGSRSTSSATLD